MLPEKQCNGSNWSIGIIAKTPKHNMKILVVWDSAIQMYSMISASRHHIPVVKVKIPKRNLSHSQSPNRQSLTMPHGPCPWSSSTETLQKLQGTSGEPAILWSICFSARSVYRKISKLVCKYHGSHSTAHVQDDRTIWEYDKGNKRRATFTRLRERCVLEERPEVDRNKC